MSYLFGNPVQVANVVPDVDREIDRYIAAGVGPFYTMRRIRPKARHRGARHDPLITAAFGYTGDVQIELIEQHDDTPSAYLEYLERHPGGGQHHLAFYCASFPEAVATAARHGQKLTVVQEYLGPNDEPFEIYYEADQDADPLLIQLNPPGLYHDLFTSIHEASTRWSGEDPVRDALAMLPANMRPNVEP